MDIYSISEYIIEQIGYHVGIDNYRSLISLSRSNKRVYSILKPLIDKFQNCIPWNISISYFYRYANITINKISITVGNHVSVNSHNVDDQKSIRNHNLKRSMESIDHLNLFSTISHLTWRGYGGNVIEKIKSGYLTVEGMKIVPIWIRLDHLHERIFFVDIDSNIKAIKNNNHPAMYFYFDEVEVEFASLGPLSPIPNNEIVEKIQRIYTSNTEIEWRKRSKSG